MPGIGVGFVAQVLRRLAREEGIPAGVSSGAALHAALTALTPCNLFVIQS
jgi:cysteine synthase